MWSAEQVELMLSGYPELWLQGFWWAVGIGLPLNLVIMVLRRKGVL